MRPLKIAITADPYLPVPPKLYGGIERVIDFLVRGLVARGHEIALFAHPESHTDGRLVPYGVPPHVGTRARLAELWQVGAGLWRDRAGIDLVHSFGRLDSVRFTGCSSSVYRDRPSRGAGTWHTVFNGVPIAKYDFVPRVAPDAPLVFLGRLEPMKGAHHAIAIARQSGRQLIIAGNRVEEGAGVRYFAERIAPALDGGQITYLGPVDDTQKNDLLGAAAALLMPVEWEEPFGIVMAEALACGTPVIGFPLGSVPEVVRDGVTGYLCPTADDAASAVGRLDRLDRSAARADCEARFSDTAIVDAYERIYAEMTGP